MKRFIQLAALRLICFLMATSATGQANLPLLGVGRTSAGAWNSPPVQQASVDCNVNNVTCTVTFANPTTVGNTIFVPYSNYGSSTFLATDNGSTSNTYTINGGNYLAQGAFNMGVFYAPVLYASTVVTLNWTTTNQTSATAFEFSGGNSSPADAGGNSHGSQGNSDSGTTTSLAQAVGDELYFAISIVNGTPQQTMNTAGFTSCQFGTSSGMYRTGCAYGIVAGTGAQTINWTWTGATLYGNVPVNFKHQ